MVEVQVGEQDVDVLAHAGQGDAQAADPGAGVEDEAAAVAEAHADA